MGRGSYKSHLGLDPVKTIHTWALPEQWVSLTPKLRWIACTFHVRDLRPLSHYLTCKKGTILLYVSRQIFLRQITRICFRRISWAWFNLTVVIYPPTTAAPPSSIFTGHTMNNTNKLMSTGKNMNRCKLVLFDDLMFYFFMSN